MRIVLALCVLTATAFADQRPVFMATTQFEACQTTTMFACGMNNGTYGTAYERKICTRMTFHADGTFSSTTDGLEEMEGTYRIFAGKMTLETDDQKFDLKLSPDRTKLGNMSLVTRRVRAPE